jgi:DNA-binding protein H-NS
MSTEALNRIIKEVNALTPQERRELFDRLTHEKQTSKEQIGRSPAALSSLSTHEEEMAANGTTLAEWLNEARSMRAELPLTSDSVDILRELREVRSRQ